MTKDAVLHVVVEGRVQMYLCILAFERAASHEHPHTTHVLIGASRDQGIDNMQFITHY